MRLPSPELNPIPESTVSGLQADIAKLQRIGMGCSKPHSSELEELRKRFNKYRNGEISQAQFISNARLARAFLYSYPGDLAAGDAIPFDTNLLDVVWNHLGKRPNGLLATYFTCYQDLPSCSELAQRLEDHYNSLSMEECPSLERKVKMNAQTLFSNQGPKIAATIAAERGESIPTTEYGLGIPSDGKFHDEVLKWHYVYHARCLPIGEVSDCLKEASEKYICEQPLEDRMLGHSVVEALCLKCTDVNWALPLSWLKIILRIAGDPRIGVATSQYQRWWALQKASVIKMVKAALAKRDIEYFLQALENFANTEGGDMERMYHPRRMFLSGILKTGSVKDALLILSQDAVRTIRRGLPKDEQKYFACSYLRDSSIRQCCIYIEVDRGHIIEGTHQSRFRMFAEDSQFACQIRDSRPEQISYNDITASDVLDEFNHHPPISWQCKVMGQLNSRFGIKVDPQNAFDVADYRDFTLNYRLPY